LALRSLDQFPSWLIQAESHVPPRDEDSSQEDVNNTVDQIEEESEAFEEESESLESSENSDN
jgi:hypothetical protein